MNDKGKGINHSGVGCHYYNRLTENTINNVVRIAITMMSHDALRWPDVSDKSL